MAIKRHPIITGAALVLALGSAARAQVGEAYRPRLSASLSRAPDRPLTLRTARRLKPGMVIVDRHGAKVGVILQTNQVRNGRPAVLLDVNGAQFTVATSKLQLTRNGDEAVTSLTRSQILTSAILNTE